MRGKGSKQEREKGLRPGEGARGFEWFKRSCSGKLPYFCALRDVFLLFCSIFNLGANWDGWVHVPRGTFPFWKEFPRCSTWNKTGPGLAWKSLLWGFSVKAFTVFRLITAKMWVRRYNSLRFDRGPGIHTFAGERLCML